MIQRVIVLGVAAALGAPCAIVAASRHDAAFWRSIVQHDYTPPPGSSVPELSVELSDMLGSADPELRDEIAYSTLAAWIYQKRLIEPEDLRTLMTQWIGNLKDGVGAQDTDLVFRRSFSALALSVIIARDLAVPFLQPPEYRRTLDAALEYLQAERDLRGYDATKGWIHSAAHTADLLKFLARSPHLEHGDQQHILDGITTKLSGAAGVFTHGEDERFARAVLSVIRRQDFDQEGFRGWVNRSRPALPGSGRPTPAQLRASQNVKNLLAKLEVLLSLDGQASQGVQAARDSVRAALKDLF
jgi:hypothetical protein